MRVEFYGGPKDGERVDVADRACALVTFPHAHGTRMGDLVYRRVTWGPTSGPVRFAFSRILWHNRERADATGEGEEAL